MTLTHGFKFVREEFINEIQSKARIYIHEKSGAELLSISNRDENKVFGITFRTPPWDSTGVAHILEHSVLCGSRKFPVKEPFVELLKGSLQTFLNAFTYPDKTCYPVASQNLQDFYNLVDIYMDAVLHPLLEKHTFEQEAWHYELNSPDEAPIYKGVVFNEMKGVYASADALLTEHSQRLLFPNTTYGVDYGGDPTHIPELTWEQLRFFHQKYYHPSNARIYFYGDDDQDERLRMMDEYLKEYSRTEIDSQVVLQSDDRKLPALVTLPYPVGADDNDADVQLTVNWRLGEITDLEEAMGLYLLDSILTDTPASPLRKALIDSGLGEDLTGAGLETQIRQIYFSTGMKGVETGNEGDVIQLIDKTLRALASDGIDPKTIEAAINTEEFHFREMNTGNYPRGLSIMIACLQTWLYDRDPLAPLRYQAPLTSIKQRILAGERYFESLITKWLLNNPHRTALILKPDPDLKNRLDREEKAILAKQKSVWSEDEIKHIINNTAALKKRQATVDSPQALKCIPGLSRHDVDKTNKLLPIDVSEIHHVPFLFHDLLTQGISYLDIGFNLKSVPSELLGLVPVWSRALLETGTGKEDFVSMTQRIGRLTGGIEPELFSSSRMNNSGSTSWLFLRGKAMDDRLEDLLFILDDILSSAQLSNRERIKQLIAEDKAELESSIIPSGHRFVSLRLRARFNESDWIQEQLNGVSYLHTLRRLTTMIDEDWPALLRQLNQVHQHLTSKRNLLINLTAIGSSRNQAEKLIGSFLSRRNDGLPEEKSGSSFAALPSGPEGLLIPAQVNYVGKSMNLFSQNFSISGHSLVVNRYLRTAWLWDQVRVQGGAYGAFTALDYRSGQLTMVSYRDPNVAKTLEVYDQTGRYLQELNLDEEEINRAVIGAIGDLDSYLLPDAKGFVSMGRYLAGDSDEYRKKIRDEVLATTLDHFHEFGRQISSFAQQGQIVIMGSQESVGSFPGISTTPVL